MEGTRAGERPRACCVLWHGAGADVRALEAGLRRRGIEVRHALTAYAALAELCADRDAGSNGPVTPISLVVVEPDRLARAGEVARAASRYAPGAVIWAFDRGQRPLLWAATTSDIDAWCRLAGLDVADAPEPAPATPARGGGHTRPLKLSGQGPEHPTGQPDNGEAEPENVRHVLTPEELEMLLSGEEPRGGAGP